MSSQNKTSQALHERTVLDCVVDMVQGGNLDNFFGFTSEDTKRFCEAFESLQQNQETKFPDFYNDSACIELFRISSSEVLRHGGALQEMQDGELRKTIAKDDAEAEKGFAHERRTYIKEHPAHSYENLSKSLRSQCGKHLASLRSCKKEFKTRIFVIEYREVDIQCAFKPAGTCDYEGLRIGDLLPIYKERRQWGLYRLSRDKVNLLWLQSNLQDVDFLVFLGNKHIEAINHRNADVLAKFLPWELIPMQAPSFTLATSVYLSKEA